MSHSVRRHLRVEVDAYDHQIRRFIPGYEEMIRYAARTVAAVSPRLILDLGAGTGALSEAVLEEMTVRGLPGQVELWDVDPEMLARGAARLERFGDRAKSVERSFLDSFPPCDVIMASLSLHHISTLAGKAELYGRASEALRPGGVLVNADATMPSGGPDRDRDFRAWADHLVASGIDEGQAWRHFEEWSQEDTYFPLEDELRALRDAGFEAECLWQSRPFAVLVGRQPG